ncbi:hypothetical protein CQW23_06111 [Capsicum baccatum]|uniref:Uncharacterized protein n=1 Tax=Capsicum baccatum TaxID=33114 RepID=A0A2G2X2J3_CAPBA|nr:hypothetical protein CQW23_06111 [Capsicum baccatum]
MPPQRREHKDTSKGHTRPLIRPGIVAVGVYQVEYNFTTLNIRFLSRRVINTDTKVTKRSDVVIDNIRYTPRHGSKW